MKDLVATEPTSNPRHVGQLQGDVLRHVLRVAGGRSSELLGIPSLWGLEPGSFIVLVVFLFCGCCSSLPVGAGEETKVLQVIGVSDVFLTSSSYEKRRNQ